MGSRQGAYNPATVATYTPHLFAVLVLATPALDRAQTQQAPPFKVQLRASTHHPVALKPWRYALTVTDLKGRPIRARAVFKIVFRGETPPPPRLLARVAFRGRAAGMYRWPSLLRGAPLEFQAAVTAKGVTFTLRYAVSVR